MIFRRSAEDQIYTAPTGGLYRIDAYGERGGNTGGQGVGLGATGYNGTGWYNLGKPGNGGKVTGYAILKKGETITLRVAKAHPQQSMFGQIGRKITTIIPRQRVGVGDALSYV